MCPFLIWHLSVNFCWGPTCLTSQLKCGFPKVKGIILGAPHTEDCSMLRYGVPYLRKLPSSDISMIIVQIYLDCLEVCDSWKVGFIKIQLLFLPQVGYL